MASPRVLLPMVLALLATSALVPAHAQLRDTVGQMPPDPNVPPTTPRSLVAQPGATLPTLDDEIRATEARRKAREQSRAVTSAGNPVLDPRTRGQVLRPVRGITQLRRPSNRAVPLRQGRPDTAASPDLPQIIAPGLSDTPVVKRRRPMEDDPYAPLGLRLGSFIVKPGIDVTGGYDTNPQRASKASRPKGSPTVQIAPDISVQSDWARHALQFDLRGTYNHYFEDTNSDRPTMDSKLTFRGDMMEGGTLNLELREKIDSQRPGSPDLTSTVKGRPLTYQTGASAGYTQKFGNTSLTGTVLADRYDFQDGKTTSGLTVSQKDRALTAYGAKLRGAYEITPGITPYVEASVDRRTYDMSVDTSGYQRDSVGAAAKVGTTFEISRILTGELSVGYGGRDYADSRLRNLSGALIDASLVWALSPISKMTVKAGSEFLETTQTGSSGAISRRIGVAYTHDLLRNLQLTASADYSRASYSGVSRIEQTFIAGLRADYKIDRNFVFRASYSYERAISSLAGNSSTAHVMLGGLRMQY